MFTPHLDDPITQTPLRNWHPKLGDALAAEIEKRLPAYKEVLRRLGSGAAQRIGATSFAEVGATIAKPNPGSRIATAIAGAAIAVTAGAAAQAQDPATGLSAAEQARANLAGRPEEAATAMRQ